MRLAVMMLALLVTGLSWPAAASTTRGDGTVVYRARKGDSLYELARRYFRRLSDFTVVQRLNRVSNPRRLPIGKALRIPRPLLRFQPLNATIIAYRGQIRLTRGKRQMGIAVGSVITEGDAIATSANSFVTLQLPDDSIVSLPSQSDIRVDRLRRIDLTGSVERLFNLRSGRTRAIVAPLSAPDDSFDVSTPVAVSAVRGTEFRASYDAESAKAATEVLDGTVEVAAGSAGESRMVEAGHGAVSTATATVEALLLAAPRLADAGRVQDEPSLAFAAEPMATASRYHFAIAADAGFLDTLAETFSNEPRASFDSIPDGTWFVRVAAIDAGGLEGLPATYGFERRLNTIETALDQRKVGRYREYLFRWRASGEGVRQYRFQLFRGSMETTPMVDEAGLTSQGFVVTDLPPGDYLWRVMTLQVLGDKVHTKWSSPERLTIGKAR